MNDKNTPSDSLKPKTKKKGTEGSGPRDLSFNYKLDKTRMKDTMGRYRIASLFDTGRTTSEDPPVFTTQDDHTDTLPSFKRLYVEIGDPSEYRIAKALLGSWEHWTRLCASEWAKPLLQECREELNALIRSEALERIKRDGLTAFSESVKFNANKFLAQGDYQVEGEKELEKEKAKRGRPSKEEIERRTKEILTEEALIQRDLDRVKNTFEQMDLTDNGSSKH